MIFSPIILVFLVVYLVPNALFLVLFLFNLFVPPIGGIVSCLLGFLFRGRFLLLGFFLKHLQHSVRHHKPPNHVQRPQYNCQKP
jgi:uncharacterized protein involved in cysteine biosynthesis